MYGRVLLPLDISLARYKTNQASEPQIYEEKAFENLKNISSITKDGFFESEIQ